MLSHAGTGIGAATSKAGDHVPSGTRESNVGRDRAATDGSRRGLRQRPWPSEREVAYAVGQWAGYASTDLRLRAAGQLAAAREYSTPGSVPTHGDCHVGNLVRGPGGRAPWVDWQDACLSTGLDDLVFLWHRAEFDGAHPQREAMTSAYLAARPVSLDSDIRAAIAVCELRSLLVTWPSFLRDGEQDRQQVMARRLQQVVDDGPDP